MKKITQVTLLAIILGSTFFLSPVHGMKIVKEEEEISESQNIPMEDEDDNKFFHEIFNNEGLKRRAIQRELSIDFCKILTGNNPQQQHAAKFFSDAVIKKFHTLSNFAKISHFSSKLEKKRSLSSFVDEFLKEAEERLKQMSPKHQEFFYACIKHGFNECDRRLDSKNYWHMMMAVAVFFGLLDLLVLFSNGPVCSYKTGEEVCRQSTWDDFKSFSIFYGIVFLAFGNVAYFTCKYGSRLMMLCGLDRSFNEASEYFAFLPRMKRAWNQIGNQLKINHNEVNQHLRRLKAMQRGKIKYE